MVVIGATVLLASPLLLHSTGPVARSPPPHSARSPPPRAFDDGAIVIAAAGLAAAAGLLQYSVSAGDQGINAFLGKEKRDNPFYKADFKAAKPEVPRWLEGVRLPSLPFVEVRGGAPGDTPSAPSPSQPPSDVEGLYRALDEAIEREAYDEAAYFKQRIDRLLGEEGG